MHYLILACTVAAVLLISCATCTPVDLNDPYAYRSFLEAAKNINGRFVAPLAAEGLDGFDIAYGHYNSYGLIFLIVQYDYPYTIVTCRATVYWSRGSPYRVSQGGCFYNFNNYYNN